MKPLDRAFNAAVLAMAELKFPHGFDVSPNAPGTLDDLKAWLAAGKRMTVFDGASDATIFGDAKVNHAFRAWHDWHHVRHNLPFTPEGERRVCLFQIADLVAKYGVNNMTRQWATYLDAEVNGQLAYAEHHADAFPVNQAAFVAAYLQAPDAAIRATF